MESFGCARCTLDELPAQCYSFLDEKKNGVHDMNDVEEVLEGWRGDVKGS